MSRIHADQLVYLAIGVPETNRKMWRDTAIGTLERRGFAVMELSPSDICEQAAHIQKTIERIKEQTT